MRAQVGNVPPVVTEEVAMTLRSRFAEGVADATGYWWLLLVTGILWVLVSLAILQFNLTSVWSIALLAGIVLCVAAANEFMLTAMAPSWKWAHALLGVFFLVGGIVAFAWPSSTFIVLARLIAWYLIFLGAFEIAESLASRGDLWGLRLAAGIASIAIAFWAVESFARSAALLVLWVGIGALMRGISEIFTAFEWRHVHNRAREIAGPAAVPIPRDVDLTTGTEAPQHT